MRRDIGLSAGVLVVMLVLSGVVVSACEQAADCEIEVHSVDGEVPLPLPSSTPQPPEFIQAKWESGPHANTYVTDEGGLNGACARCHAPLNWIPASDEIPPSWTASEVEVGLPVDSLAEGEWSAIACKVCHREEVDQISGDIAWLEVAPLGEYSQVNSPTELCEKCHLAGDVDGHVSVVVEGSHVDFACTDCHDSHDASASCSGSGCHEPFTAECKTIDGHTQPHADSTCGACHDAGGLLIARDEERGMWQTFVPVAGSSGEEIRPFVSHNLSLEVPCERCHEPGNHPWGDSIEAYD